MKALLRLGWRGLSRNRRFSALFIINLALGLTGFLLIGSFGASLSRHLDAHLKEILTADLVLQTSRPLNEQEIALSHTMAGPGSRFSQQVSLYTMVKGNGVSRLAQIVAIDEAYPLYGNFHSAVEPLDDNVITDLQQQRQLVMSREAARSFALTPGDILQIGQVGYALAAYIARDPGNNFTGLSLAPKIYIGLPQLQESGLLRFGSRVTYQHFIRLPDTANAAAVAAQITTALAELSPKAPEVRVSTTVDVNRRLGRVIGYFSSFLGLAAMVSLGLAGLAAAFLFREHLRSGLKEIAILLSLGASRGQCLVLSMGELALLGLVAASCSIALAWLLLPLFGHLFIGIIPANLPLRIDPAAALATLVIGVVGSLLFCLPVYRRILEVRPLWLLREEIENAPAPGKAALKHLAALLPAVGLLLLLTLLLSHSPFQGLGFTAGLLVLVVVFALMAKLLFIGCRRWSHTRSLTWRIVWRNLYRNRLAASAVFVALGMALLLVNLIPQVEKGLTAEIGQPEGLELPDLFLIDVQEEQQQPLHLFFQGERAALSPLAPMVQGRIVSINGLPFAHWRQQHSNGDERGLRRTEFNFSSREQLDHSETVVEGPPMSTVPWAADSNQPFAISMEREFGERLQVGIGDRLIVDILGIELEGQVVNLRKVRWNSFQPNFFMLVQKGVLDDAPKTYLASVSRVEKDKKEVLVNRLTAAFPNVSVIDVSGTVAQLSTIAGQLSQSLRFMAGLAMAIGLVTVVSIARQEALRREREINLLRVLGAGIGRIRTLFILEFAVLSAAAALTALLLSVLCSLAISWLLFDRLWQFQWQSNAFLLLAVPLMCALTALLATDSLIRRKPTALLD
ncbi:FtsX-like permease family protein [uncultured Desulfobulbus sp.]|uniref:ABC transporter permease n=1 Tax=uncultured Desulfobulbus sp. TaxID=239745 RepID=UPI0029C631EC|nr:FtsX-like permease family protein [uncultured Desulfobulbus sp.]